MENEKYIMFYEIQENNDFIRILGEEFVRKNKNKGKIIYKNKKYYLRGLFKLKNVIEGNLKILIALSKDCYNKSFMFKDCLSLIQIKFKDNFYNREDISFKEKNKLLMELNHSEETENIRSIDNNIENDFFKWNTKISSMNEIFSNCSSLLSIPDISGWDTSNIFDLSKIFYNCASLSSIPDISNWNTDKVIDMNGMFFNCSSLPIIPDMFKNNIKNISNIDKIFFNCFSLASLPNIYDWKNIKFIIKDCISLISLPIIDKRKLKHMTISSMSEKSCSIFKLIYDISKDKIIKIFDSRFILNNLNKCKMIIENKIYLLTEKYKIFDYNKNNLKIKLMIMDCKKLNLSCMFYDCSSLKEFNGLTKEAEFKSNKLKEEKKIKKLNINI